MTKTQWVPASRRDIKPGAQLRIVFQKENERPVVYGKVDVHPVQMRRGDLHFRLDIGTTDAPLLVRHGLYTGTTIEVLVVPAERIRSLTTARKRHWSTPEPTRDAIFSGGPFDGQTWTCTQHHPVNTLAFTVNGVTGAYRDGNWVT